LTPLIGRKKELVDVLRLFSDGVRLVTVTGPRGIGKTRLALEVAHELARRSTDRVCFVDLSLFRDGERVVPMVARELGVVDGPPERVIDRELLLVLDGLENVADGAGALDEILCRSPEARLLATSRQAVHVAGEQAYPLRPLAEAPAAELLRSCAQAVDASFDAEFATLAVIADRLGRLPLALELAGARLVAEGPSEVLRSLD
jgi:predicted ATPase